MAYTRVWDDTAPPDGRDADEIGAAIRELRVDIDQRLSSFFTDIDTDPLVPNTTYSGAATNRELVIPPYQLINDDVLSIAANNSEVILTSGAAGQAVRVPVIVPVGYVITGFKSYLSNTSGKTIKAALHGLTITTALSDSNISGDIAQVGDGTTIYALTSGVLAHTVLNTDAFHIKIELTTAPTNVAKYYGSVITITKANNSQGY